MKKAKSGGASDNTDFMDAVVVAAESWPLLLGLPVLAGIVSFTLVAVAPTQYRAASTIPPIEGAQALIDSAEFDRQFATSGLTAEDFTLAASFEPVTRSTTITATAPDADDARAAVEKTITTLRSLSPIPTPSLAQQAKLLSAQIGRLEDFATSLETSLQSPSSAGASALEITDAIVALTDAIAAKQETLGEIQDQLETEEKIAATSPEVVVAPVRKDQRVVLAAILAAATLASALVYARFRLMQARKLPGFEAKRARVVRALTFNLFGGRSDNGSKP